MLVLTRKRDEVIMIGHDIKIVIVETAKDRVRLGIQCPNEIPVHRKEVYDEINGKKPQE